MNTLKNQIKFGVRKLPHYYVVLSKGDIYVDLEYKRENLIRIATHFCPNFSNLNNDQKLM